MKIRNGFVSNSSSSSFVILKEGLTELQQAKILAYENEGYWIQNLKFVIYGSGEWYNDVAMDDFFKALGLTKENLEWIPA